MSFERWGYTFEGAFSRPESLPPGQGVYVIWCEPEQGGWLVLDVGESEDARERVMHHERAGCWRRNCRGTIYYSATYTPGFTEEQRRAIEQRIRNLKNPPCGEE